MFGHIAASNLASKTKIKRNAENFKEDENLAGLQPKPSDIIALENSAIYRKATSLMKDADAVSSR